MRTNRVIIIQFVCLLSICRYAGGASESMCVAVLSYQQTSRGLSKESFLV